MPGRPTLKDVMATLDLKCDVLERRIQPGERPLTKREIRGMIAVARVVIHEFYRTTEGSE